MIDELLDYEDKIMEAGQSGFGRFGDGEINGEKIEENDPIKLIDLIIEKISTKLLKIISITLVKCHG